MNLIEYKEHVRSLARIRDGEPVFNASVEHAAIAIENLFSSAMAHVDILSGACNARVFGRSAVVEEARLFLASSAENRLRIILEKDVPKDRAIHPFFQMCSEFPNVDLRFASQDVQDQYGFHLIVTDNDNYRFEIDKTKTPAVAAFGDDAGAGNLVDIYEHLWNQCSPIEITH